MFFHCSKEVPKKGEGGFLVSNGTDCSTCINRHIHFPDMDDNKISMQECLCDGEDYEEE